MDFIFPVLFFGIMGVVLFVVVKTAAKRKERFALLGQQASLHLSGGGFSNIVLQGVHEGYPVTFTFTPSGKNTPPYMTAAYLCMLPITVTLRPQGIGTSLKLTLGLGRDLQIGHRDVDDAFEIDGPEDPGLLRFMGDADVQKVLLDLHAHQLSELYFTEQGISFRRVIDESLLDAEFLKDTAQILHWLSLLAHRHGTGHVAYAEQVPPPALPEAAVDVGSAVDLGSMFGDEPMSVPVPEPATEPEPEPAPEPEPWESEPEGSTTEPAEPEELALSADEPESAVSEEPQDDQRQDDVNVEQLVQQLNDYQLRDDAEAALLALGPAAVPALVAALEDAILAYQVTEVLARADEPMTQALVAELPNISDERALTKALEVCTRLRPAGGAETIEAFLNHDSFLVRYEAERALAAVKEGAG